jgi:transposase-like protein
MAIKGRSEDGRDPKNWMDKFVKLTNLSGVTQCKRLPRRQFTTEYKAEAVKLVLEQGLNQSHAARQLNISVKSLVNWIHQHNTGQLKGSQKTVHEIEFVEHMVVKG